MLIFAQFPITDIRQFDAQSNSKLVAPLWPAPIPYNEFMRTGGQIRSRQKGGVAGWMGESEICDVHRAVKYLEFGEYFDRSLKTQVSAKNLASYFYSDGIALNKYELVLKFTHKPVRSKLIIGSDSLCALGRKHIEVKVGKEMYTTSLLQSGKFFANHYEYASTPLEVYRQSSERRSIYNELQLLYIDVGQHERFKPPTNAHRIDMTERFGIDLYFWWLQCQGGIRIPVWTARDLLHTITRRRNILTNENRSKYIRLIRLYIMRLHAEYHVLRRVLRAIESNMIVIQTDSSETKALQKYLNIATRRIGRIHHRTNRKIDMTEIEEVVKQSLEIVNPGQRDALLQKLEMIRPRVLDKVHQVMNNIYMENVTVNEKKIEINVNDQGKLEITGDIVIGDEIKNSFNKAAAIEENDLRQLVQDLTVAVGNMSSQLSEHEQREVAQDLDTVATETAKEEPSKRYLKFSIEGLKKAAKDVGEIGTPVIELAVKIATALSLGL